MIVLGYVFFVSLTMKKPPTVAGLVRKPFTTVFCHISYKKENIFWLVLYIDMSVKMNVVL